MKALVGIKKGTSKPLTAGVVARYEGMELWEALLYRIINGKVVPFSGQTFKTQEKAALSLCKHLRIDLDELVEMEEDAADDYILQAMREKSKSSRPASTYTETAKQFCDLIVNLDYVGAHALLTNELKAEQSPSDLKKIVERMIAYARKPLTEVQVMEDFILEDWPDKLDGDVASVYVALSGEGYSEAVNMILVKSGDGFLIRDLEWGRP